jgi:transcriptional accessory protein Tex/SPT6
MLLKEGSVEIYQKTIRQQQIQSLLDIFLDKMFHCNSEGVNLAVENLIVYLTFQLPYQI